MRAVVNLGDGTVGVRDDVPKPVPGPGEILVKVLYAGLNPTDWKHAYMAAKVPIVVGTVSGCDYVGVVDSVGADVPESLRRVGQRVAGAIHGSNAWSPFPNGALSEYLVVDAKLSFLVPEDIPPELLAGQPVAAITATQILWQSLGEHNLPTPEAPGDFSSWFLVWSGATAVGRWLIQLARLSGLRVVATASPRNWDMLRSLGADAVFDYRSPTVAEDIRAATGGTLAYGALCEIDGTADELRKPAIALRDAGGALSAITLFEIPDLGLDKPVKIDLCLGYTLMGQPLVTPLELPAFPDHYEIACKRLIPLIQSLLEQKKIELVPVRIYGGLESTQAALTELREGKAIGERLVISVV
ncbi:GroES-like protein [Auricularia subglabra TFB-10046 SS5]|nr:GroES-like protein [Auricularia subglabra TFB-10046 SS5]